MVRSGRAAVLLPLLAFLALLVPSAALADAAYAFTVTPFGNTELTTEVTVGPAYGADKLVSGTKVEIAGTGSGRLNKAGTVTYDEAVAVSGKVEIGGTDTGETVFHPGLARSAGMRAARGGRRGGGSGPVVYGGSTQPNWTPLAQESLGVRFASTHFQDGDAIPVKVTITWKLYKNNQYLATTTTSASVTVEAYNQLQTLGTNKKQDDDDAALYVYSSLFEGASNKTTGSAATKLDPNHSAIPGPSALTETKNDILDKAAFCTAVSAMIHGNVLGVYQSNPSAAVSDFVYFAAIQNIIAGRDYPDYNLVGFWSCHTLNASNLSNSAPIVAYRTILAGPDHAYIGFDKDVNIQVWPPSVYASKKAFPDYIIPPAAHDLGDHATLFWQKIKEGATVEQALRQANADFPPTDGNSPEDNPSPIDMKLVGDPRTNLINVYLTQAEFDACNAATPKKDTNVWWIKL